MQSSHYGRVERKHHKHGTCGGTSHLPVETDRRWRWPRFPVKVFYGEGRITVMKRDCVWTRQLYPLLLGIKGYPRSFVSCVELEDNPFSVSSYLERLLYLPPSVFLSFTLSLPPVLTTLNTVTVVIFLRCHLYPFIFFLFHLPLRSLFLQVKLLFCICPHLSFCKCYSQKIVCFP